MDIERTPTEPTAWIGDRTVSASAFAVAFRGGQDAEQGSTPARLRRLLEAAAKGVLRGSDVEVRKAQPGRLLATVRAKQGLLVINRAPSGEGVLTAYALGDPSHLIKAVEGVFLRLQPDEVALGDVGVGAPATWTPYMSEGALFVRMIHDRTTPYQQIQVGEHPAYGRLLFLNGETQIGEHDEARYSAALVRAAVRKRTRRVAILGGGDCGVLREVLTHDVEEVVMIEIDKEVVEVASAFFPATVGGATSDPRATIVYQEAMAYLDQRAASDAPPFDLIIYDLSDDPLELESFDQLCERVHACLAPKGRVAVQCGSGIPMYQQSQKRHLKGLRRHFRKVTTEEVVIDSFLQQPWVFAIAKRRDGV